MGDKKYVITDGKNYIAHASSGMTIVGNINKAKQYSKVKAENCIKSLPKTFKKFDFKVKEFVQENETEQNDRDIIFKKLQEDDIKYKGLMVNIFDRMLDFETYIKDLQGYDKYIDVQLEVLKRALRDAEHKFELDNLDMYSSWLIGKDIQKIQQRRRTLKEDKEKIKYIMERNFVDCTSNMISSHIREMEQKESTYTARYLDYLFT